MVKKAVLSYWEAKLLHEASSLPSLKYFQPSQMSLSTSHPLWLSARSSPYEVSKARVQAQMLSGRYRTELLSSHWSSNADGWCLTPECKGLMTTEDIEHILVACRSLDVTRETLQLFTSRFALSNPVLNPILIKYLDPSNPLYCQFLLDCSCIPDVILISQLYGNTLLNKLFYVTRTWCYSLHRARARLLGRWHCNWFKCKTWLGPTDLVATNNLVQYLETIIVLLTEI